MKPSPRRKREHVVPRWLAMVGASLLILTACGGQEEAAPPPEPEAPAAEEPAEPEEAEEPAAECDVPGTCEPSDELIAAAQAEGQVVTFSAIAATLQDAFASAFEARYGITVDFAQVQVGEAIERALLEHESGNVSLDLLVHSNDIAHADFSDQGIYAQLNVDEIPNLAVVADDPNMYRGTFAFWGGAAWNLAWNTDLVDDADVPNDWCDLADERWNGEIGLVDQPGAASVYGVFGMMEEICGEGILEAIAANNPVWFVSTAPLSDALTAGEVSIGAPVIHTIVPRKADGAPVDWKVLDGMSIGARYMAIMDQAPNPNAAKLFANWLLSEEAQSIAYSNAQGVTVLTDLITDAIPTPSTFELASNAVYDEARQSEIRTRLGLE